MSMYSCCLCGKTCSGMDTITPFGLSPNLCTDCLPEVQHGHINPPPGLLVLKEDFDSAQDLKNCCESVMNMNYKEEVNNEI